MFGSESTEIELVVFEVCFIGGYLNCACSCKACGRV